MLCCTILLLLMVGLRKVFIVACSWAGREISAVTAMPPVARRVVTPESPVSVVSGR